MPDETGSQSLNISESEAGIYEDGQVTGISIAELQGNEIAIRQLVNSHIVAHKRLAQAHTALASAQGEVEYLRTSPFVAIVSLAINTLGAVCVGLGSNLWTSGKQFGITLTVVGSTLTLVAGFSTWLFPYARNWFNKGR